MAKLNAFKDGEDILPSLMTREQEQQFKIQNNWFVDDLSKLDSLKSIRNYEIADQYRSIYLHLNQNDELLLNFIAEFKSVQKLHILREAALFPELFDSKTVNRTLRNLFINNLIWKWEYDHPVYGRAVDVYTLSTNGYYLLRLMSGKDEYFYPGLFLNRKLPDIFHVRFWETIDLYQVFVSLPAYRGSTTLFNGDDDNKIVNSPLQVAIEDQKDTRNLIIYPVLQTDGDIYYDHVIKKWAEYTNQGNGIGKSINKLPGKTNVLTFYVPTGQLAAEFSDHFQLSEAPFPIYFIVGSIIQRYGINQAVYVPDQSQNAIRQANVNFS